ncbi:MAG: sugar phosphate isomerase/epimerase [Clostridia bacterium]|nr:sugar phosphate isomerase/epimerase [Clostridia bacterium]
MKIGICWHGKIEANKQIELMKQNGFEATFLMSNDPKLDETVPLLRENGIECVNCHAPFDGINAIWNADDSGEKMLDRLISGVEACARNRIPVLVVHLSSGDNAPRINDVGQARFDRLMETARKAGVTIAFENQRKLGNLANAMEQYPDAAFCWDVGHEACFAYGKPFMPLFGDRIAALHLHDNFGIHNGDDHLLPYDGTLDMVAAARQLAESPFHDVIMLEVIPGKTGKYHDMTIEEYYRRAGDAARRFAATVERYRK